MEKVTIHSPSEYHLGHHHVLFISDGIHHEEYETNYSERVWRLQHNIVKILLSNEFPLK